MGPRIAVTFNDPRKLAPYIEALCQVRIQPLTLPPDTAASLDGLQGLLLTGGGDVDPGLYGQPRQTATQHVDRARDTLELRLLDEVLRRDLPVLAICRGLQMLNVALGGTLKQDIADHRKPGVGEVHSVNLVPGTRLADIVGADSCLVNSRHHQAVARVGQGLVVSAEAPDGAVEGLEHPGKRFVVAVQWHPEDRVLSHACDRRLFEAFARALEPGTVHSFTDY
jgi:putative glutamine amidotransferase